VLGIHILRFLGRAASVPKPSNDKHLETQFRSAVAILAAENVILTGWAHTRDRELFLIEFGGEIDYGILSTCNAAILLDITDTKEAEHFVEEYVDCWVFA